MRDIKRIHRICVKLEKLWNYYPDQRFGQLVSNYLFNDGDPFFREDSREKWIPKDWETWEERIDKQIHECQLWERVRNETKYLKDYEKYWEKWRKWSRANPITFGMTDEEVEKRSKKEPKSPNWKDYVKYLKN